MKTVHPTVVQGSFYNFKYQFQGHGNLKLDDYWPSWHSRQSCNSRSWFNVLTHEWKWKSNGCLFMLLHAFSRCFYQRILFHFWLQPYVKFLEVTQQLFFSPYQKYKCIERREYNIWIISQDVLCRLLQILKFDGCLFCVCVCGSRKLNCKLLNVVLKHSFSPAQISIINQLWNPGRTLCSEHTVLWLAENLWFMWKQQKWDQLAEVHKSSAQLLPHSLLIMSYRSEHPLL